MIRLTVPITLTLTGPVMTRATAIGSPGVDAAMAAGLFISPQQQVVRRFYLPGTLIRGLLREAWQELAAFDEPRFGSLPGRWLGAESRDQAGSMDPDRGRLRLSDFVDWTKDPDQSEGTRIRIFVDDELGAVRSQMMQELTVPYGSGESVSFQGEVRLLLGDRERWGGLLRDLGAGLRWIRSVGAYRSVGFGRLLRVEVGNPIEQQLPGPEAVVPGEHWKLQLRFRTPVIFAKRRISDNLFESATGVAGGAIKGAIAEMMKTEPKSFAQLAAELYKVRFTHAFPSEEGMGRPKQWPLSLALVDRTGAEGEGQPELVDCIGEPAVPDNVKAVSFDIDWKKATEETVRRNYGWPEDRFDLRVRTAIEGEAGVADESRLFAWKMLIPHGRVWTGYVRTTGLSDEARQQLSRLLMFGVEPLGKAKNLATVTLEREAEEEEIGGGNEYVLIMQTAGLLVAPHRTLAPHGGIGSGEETTMREEYHAVWEEISGGSLSVADYFHRLSLAGSRYLGKRFGQPQYRPYLLTEAGSVFRLSVVTGREVEARECVQRWIREGLPVSATVREFYVQRTVADKDLWQFCPYLPENGYGEIAIHQTMPGAK
jgi:hypothetical protein